MSINNYLTGLEKLITTHPLVSSYTLTVDRKTQDIAFISGRIEFRGGSVLDIKEYVESKDTGIEKYMYGYNYRIGPDVLFRYDNSPDPRAKGLNTFPHHKHLKNGKLAESVQIDLVDALREIEISVAIEG